MNLQEVMSRWSLQSPEQLLAKAGNHLPLWTSVLLVILIGYYLAKIAWLFYPSADQESWTPPPVARSIGDASGSADIQSQQKIIDSHLFGSASTENLPVVVEEADDAPDTRLNLKLRATVSAEDQKIAHAIIADGSGKENVYFVRDSVPGGATLHRVHLDKVILNRGGVLEALRLPKEFDASSAPATRRTSVTNSARPVDQSSVQALITENAENFTNVIRPQPYMPNGELKGYRVFPGRERQQFMALGLRPGDLVTEINGVKLDNPAQGMEIFRTLSESSQVTITVERNGQSMAISMDTNALTEIANTTQ